MGDTEKRIADHLVEAEAMLSAAAELSDTDEPLVYDARQARLLTDQAQAHTALAVAIAQTYVPKLVLPDVPEPVLLHGPEHVYPTMPDPRRRWRCDHLNSLEARCDRMADHAGPHTAGVMLWGTEVEPEADDKRCSASIQAGERFHGYRCERSAGHTTKHRNGIAGTW